MADAVRWIEASGVAPHFTRFYEKNLLTAADVAIKADEFSRRLVEYLHKHGIVCKTYTEIMTLLQDAYYRQQDLPKHWPTNGKAVESKIQRMLPALRKFGWTMDVIDKGIGHTNQYTFRKTDAATVEANLDEIDTAEIPF
jgi:hypothetical protein